MYKIVEKYAFQPPNPPSYKKSEVNYITRSDNGVIPFLLYENIGAEYTILYTHGNAEDLGQMRSLVKLFRMHLPVNILIYDYAGYGYNGNIGECSEAATYRDIREVWKYLTETKNIAPDKIILYGRSLGTGPTVQLSAELSDRKIYVAGVILQSPLMSAVAVVSNLACYLPFMNIFVNSRKIHKILSPIFILHGVNDRVVPWEHGNYLRNHCGHNQVTFWSINGAGHNDIEAYHSSELIQRLNEFIKSLKTRNISEPSWSSCS